MEKTCGNNRCMNGTAFPASVISEISKEITDTYADGIGINHNEGSNLPREAEVLELLSKLLDLMFPGFGSREAHSVDTLIFSSAETVSELATGLCDVIVRTLRCYCRLETSCRDAVCMEHARKSTEKLLRAIPDLRRIMKKDIQSAYDGDPAARSLSEIILSYPCVKAITIQRLAHVLYEEKIPMIPRMMTEYAHRITAIDIHPGAKLGEGIFIDHGTGVVIGETATLGSNVKIYQGVTLGALSFPKDGCGKIIKGAKRHPDIEDNVTIYAGATILGAVTVGHDSVIGGNVWLTESIPPKTKITIASPDLTVIKPRI